MAQCEFCNNEAKKTWKTASISLYDVARTIVEDEKKYGEEEAIEFLAKLLKMLKGRTFDVESDEFLKVKLHRKEYIRTCDENNDCVFWNSDGVAETDAVDRILNFEGLLIEW